MRTHKHDSYSPHCNRNGGGGGTSNHALPAYVTTLFHDVVIKHVSYHNIGSAIEIDSFEECQQLLIVDFDSLKGA